ncbi:MAG: DUF4252 domain-containing protein [Cyclobacteriaceae bacterium]
MLKITCAVLLSVSLQGFSQESILKEFAEERNDFKLCLYPSTLRMINIKKDPEYNKLVSGIEKLLIYNLDSATAATKDYKEWTYKYTLRGYEEYISMSGKMNLLILGKDDEFVGATGADGRMMAFYLRGTIAFQKIPKLLETFEGGDMISLITSQLDR